VTAPGVRQCAESIIWQAALLRNKQTVAASKRGDLPAQFDSRQCRRQLPGNFKEICRLLEGNDEAMVLVTKLGLAIASIGVLANRPRGMSLNGRIYWPI